MNVVLGSWKVGGDEDISTDRITLKASEFANNYLFKLETEGVESKGKGMLSLLH